MIQEIPSSRSAKAVVSDFIHRNKEKIQRLNESAENNSLPEGKINLDIQDRETLQATLNAVAIGAATNLSKQQECLIKGNGTVDQWGETKNAVKLLEKIVDPNIPLKVVIAKRGRWASNGDFIESSFSIELYHGEDVVSRFAVREYEDGELVMGHREVLPKYKGQKISPLMIKTFEELIKAYCKKVGKKAQIDAYVSQLDVMAMFDDNGYSSVKDREPHRKHQFIERESQMLDDVMKEVEDDSILDPTADSKYVLAEKLYVNPRGGYSPEEQETDPRSQNAVGSRIANAIRVHFRKNLEPEMNEETISEIQRSTANKIGKSSFT